jgi:NACalpha-BTF3-like transcription factor
VIYIMDTNSTNEVKVLNKNQTDTTSITYKQYLINLLKKNDISTTDFNLSEEQFAGKHGITKSNFILKARETYKNYYEGGFMLDSQIVNETPESKKNILSEEHIQMVMRQTNLDYETAKESLEKESGNIEAVIKNYLSDSNYYHREKEENIQSTNQKIYSELRIFMESTL